MGRSAARSFIGPALLLATLLVAVPAFIGRPVVSYASSGSMVPTIDIHDGFFVLPVTGGLEVGDIVVFDSVVRGERAVHRIVGGDEGGWYTKGDANRAEDQMEGEPILTRDRILGRVVTHADGSPVLVPQLGVPVIEAQAETARAEAAVGGAQNLKALFFISLALVAAVPAMLARREPRARLPRRVEDVLRRLFPRGVLGWHMALAVLIILVLSVAWTASHARSDVPISLVVVTDPTVADDHYATTPGRALVRKVEVGALGLLPTVLIVDETDHLRPRERQAFAGPLEKIVLQVDHVGGKERGAQEDVLHVWRYPAVMPTPITRALHDAAPGLPYLALAAALASAGAATFAALGVARMPVGRLLGLREAWR